VKLEVEVKGGERERKLDIIDHFYQTIFTPAVSLVFVGQSSILAGLPLALVVALGQRVD
jgi:hypothetical protein